MALAIDLTPYGEKAIAQTITGVWTMTTPVLSAPVIASFASAQHTHSNAAGGGTLSGYEVAGAVATHAALTTTHGASGNVVGTAGAQGLASKTLDNTNTITLKDTLFTLQDDGDTTKQARFQLSGLTTTTTRTYTLPDVNDTLATLTATQTLTNTTVNGYLPVTGATAGASGQAQVFTNGIGIGTGATTPMTPLQVLDTSSTTPRGLMSSQRSTDALGARFYLDKARGSLASPVTINTSDNLGRIVGRGYEGTSYLEMAEIRFLATGTIATTRIPTEIQFWTATDASPSVLTQRVTINNAGNTGFGGNTSPAQAVDVTGSVKFSTALIGSVWGPANDGTAALAWTKADLSTKFLIGDSANGFVGVGLAATPATLLHVATNTTAVGIATFEQASADTDGFDLNLQKARGTVASPSAITTGDDLNAINFRGYSGASGYVTGAQIKAFSTGTIATTRIPGILTFLTGTDAAPTVLTERMRITELGRVGIGTTSPSVLLEINGGSGSTTALIKSTGNNVQLNFTSNNSNRGSVGGIGGSLCLVNTNSQGVVINTAGGAGIGMNPGNTTPTGTCMVFDDTASTGVTRLWAKEGAGQSTSEVFGVYANNGTTARYAIKGNTMAWFNATAVVQQSSAANLTNNVTSGGTTDQVDTWTDLTLYANDAAAIRNAVFQLARKLKQINDGLRAYGLFT